MMTRSLSILFQDGFNPTIQLPPSELSELDYAREFVNCINKYKDGFERFRQRAPKVTWGSKTKLYPSLDSVIHTIINARKFIDMPLGLATADQTFSINMIAGTFTLYNKSEERGTMKLDLIYSNWESIFYQEELYADLKTKLDPSFELMGESTDIEEEEEELVAVEPIQHRNTDEMREHLSDEEFALWDYCINTRGAKGKTVVHYSGSGDSGGTDSIENEHEYDLEGDVEFVDKLWKVIDSKESGFYNNDGGYGTIVINENKFSWDHHNYVTDTECTVSLDHTIGESIKPIEGMELPF